MGGEGVYVVWLKHASFMQMGMFTVQNDEFWDWYVFSRNHVWPHRCRLNFQMWCYVMPRVITFHFSSELAKPLRENPFLQFLNFTLRNRTDQNDIRDQFIKAVILTPMSFFYSQYIARSPKRLYCGKFRTFYKTPHMSDPRHIFWFFQSWLQACEIGGWNAHKQIYKYINI